MANGRIETWFTCGDASLGRRFLLQVPSSGERMIFLGHVYRVASVTWGFPKEGEQTADIDLVQEE